MSAQYLLRVECGPAGSPFPFQNRGLSSNLDFRVKRGSPLAGTDFADTQPAAPPTPQPASPGSPRFISNSSFEFEPQMRAKRTSPDARAASFFQIRGSNSNLEFRAKKGSPAAMLTVPRRRAGKRRSIYARERVTQQCRGGASQAGASRAGASQAGASRAGASRIRKATPKAGTGCGRSVTIKKIPIGTRGAAFFRCFQANLT